MNADGYRPGINQVAFSVLDLRRTEAWFVDGLGFLPAGGSIFMMSGPIAAPVMGIPRAASCGWWLVGRNAWFQLELFQFRRPLAQLMPPDFRPCDTGYTRMGVHVHDFDAALASLAALDTLPLAPPLGDPGERRACVRSPDGVYIEIMEADPLPQPPGSERADCPVAVRYVTLSTPDLDASVACLTAISGAAPESIELHGDAHEALWNLAGARCKRAVFRCGDVLVEVVEYVDPVGKPWPQGYRICDQGILNICFGQRSKAEHRRVYERALAVGAKPNFRPLHFDGGGIVYMNDPLGFSIELTWITPGSRDRKYGFEPAAAREQRPQHDKLHVVATVRIDAPLDRVWDVLMTHDEMSRWCGFDFVQRVREGFTDPNGVGAQRLMRGRLGRYVEQVTETQALRCIRYRVIEGGPVQFHNGVITLQPTAGGCEVQWSIRCRCRYPFLGRLLRRLLQRELEQMLHRGLKPYAERLAHSDRLTGE